MLNILEFESDNDSLFGMFDGGRNNEVPKLLLESVPGILREEMQRHSSPAKYMKYTMLSAHR